MKQTLIALLLALSLPCLSAQVHPKLAPYLAQCPLLEEEDRKKLSDSIRSLEEGGQTMAVAHYSPNEVMSISITLLPMINGTPVIGVIESYKRPRPDSQVRFFTPDWREITPEQVLAQPIRSESFLEGLYPSSESLTFRLRSLLSPLYTQMQWSQDGTRLIIEADAQLTLEDKAMAELTTLVGKLPRLTYIWRSGRLERM